MTEKAYVHSRYSMMVGTLQGVSGGMKRKTINAVFYVPHVLGICMWTVVPSRDTNDRIRSKSLLA